MAAVLTAIGLMSGTSMDGIDAALLQTDGERVASLGPWLTRAYDEGLRARLRMVLGGRGEVAEVAEVERAITQAHADTVLFLLKKSRVSIHDIDVIGFHGHTILHVPQEGRTWQIGDGALLARTLGIEVVNDFRSADVAAGGEGAPLAPLYHRARAHGLPRPLAVLNLGGVANLTWIGADDGLVAFDTGPGNALIDDWLQRWKAGEIDRDGAVAAAGRVEEGRLGAMLAHPYFERPPPKSLDRDDFAGLDLDGLSLADGAATLTAFTAAAVARAVPLLPAPPRRWLVCGGGRHNPTLMAMLREQLGAPVAPVEAVGWRGDALEAEAFAFLAVRSLRGLPLSLPGTTGIARPMPGGVRHAPRG